MLARRFDFDGSLLVRAITATFSRRGTPLPVALPIALTAAFIDDTGKNNQWVAFQRKANARDTGTLSESMASVSAFVTKPLLAAASETTFSERWAAGGPWI